MAHPVPLAQAAILTLVSARPALASVQVRDSPPTEADDITFSMIWLDDTVEIPDDDWSELGNRRRRMTFRIPFTVAALLNGDDAKAARETAWSYFEEVVAALRTDPTLGGSVQQFDAIPAKCSTVLTGPQQWESVITASVVCISRAY